MLRTLFLLPLLAFPLAARALCTSDGVAQPVAVLERFINADCADCWRDPATPAAGKDMVALDWVLPGRLGENAPLSVVASRDGLERLRFLNRPVPERSSSAVARREGRPVPLRLAQGETFNDYVGTSIEVKPHEGTGWTAWLVLVERLPAGVEGSPVPRNLVRNVFRPDWTRTSGRSQPALAETRSMQIHEGARPERLRLVALLQDARGQIRAITRTECP